MSTQRGAERPWGDPGTDRGAFESTPVAHRGRPRRRRTTKVDRGGRLRGSRGQPGTFWPDWESIWGVRSAWRIGRGGRGALLAKSNFFRFGGRLWIDFGSPRPAEGSQFGRSLMALGAPGASSRVRKGALGGPLGTPGALLTVHFGALRRRCPPPPTGPGTPQGAILDRF